MKYRCFFVFFFLFVALLSNAQMVQQDDWHTLKVQFKLPEIEIEKVVVEGTAFNALMVEGYFPSQQLGAPNLPLFSAMVEVPVCDGYTVTVSDALYDTVILPDGYLVPVQVSRSKSDTTRRSLTIDENLYNKDFFYRNSELASMKYVGIARDRCLARLQYAPFAYNPVTRQLIVCRKAIVTVHYENPDIETSQGVFDRYHSSMFAAGALSLNALYPKSVRTESPVRYLIVAHSSFDGQMDDFVAWKRRKGFLVDIVYTSNASVGTTSTSIAAYVKSQYTNATTDNPAPTYLLLVGDHEQIPAFTGSTDNDHVTDLNFVLWTTGDYLPDCYSGRFSAQTIAQLTPQIEKTLMYEQYTFTDPSFLDRAVMVAGIDGGSSGDFGYTHADPAMDYAITNYINGARGFTQVKYYKNNTSIVPTGSNVTLQATGSSASASCHNDYNDGAGWINYSAHGSETSWYLPSMTTSDVSGMTNTQKFGVVIGNCCLTNHFQTTTCLGEAFLRKSNYAGAVGYIGGTNSTYWNEDVYWAVGVRSGIGATMSMAYNASNLGVYDRLCHTHSEDYSNWATSMGSMIYMGNMAVESSSSALNNYYWEIYELMGDPSLMPYLTQASTMTLTASSALTMGTSSLTVTAVPYAYVAVTDTATHSLQAAGFANASGSITLSLPSTLTVGGYEIVASAQQYQTTFKTLSVVPANGPYPQVSNITATAGLVAGDTVSMTLDVTNIGNSTASNVTVALSSNNPNVILQPSMLNVGTLIADTMVTVAFTAIVSANADDDARVTITASANCSLLTGTSSQSTEFVLLAPRLRVESEISPSALLPSNEAALTVSVTNAGHAPQEATQLSLVSSSTSLSVTAVSATAIALPVGDSASLIFTLQASPTISDGTTIPIYVMLMGCSQPVDTIEIYVGENRYETFENGTLVLDGWRQGSYPWEIVDVTAREGSYSARSNTTLPHNQCSEISIMMNAAHADSVSFYYKVSSESNYDKFHFYVDGIELLVASGNVDWTRAVYPVTAGAHTFLFAYSKDGSVSSGSDCAWIDDVKIPQPVQRYVVTVTTTNGSAIGGGTYEQGQTATIGVMPEAGYAFTVWNDGNTDNPRQWVVDGNNHFVATTIANTPLHDTMYMMGADTIIEYVQVHDTTYIDVHDTTYIDVPYVVLDTINVDVHDTAYIDIHDTIYVEVPYAVHDTTTIVIDTLMLTEYMQVPAYIYVHDTAFVEVSVHDTIVITDTLMVMDYVPVHDTTYIDVLDTVYINVPYAVHDTTYITQTDTGYINVMIYDTVYLTQNDTITVYDTTVVVDTVFLEEYVEVPVNDTTYINVPYAVHDTTFVVDTLTLTEYVTTLDTVYIDVHDSVYVEVPYVMHDTTIVIDTMMLTEYVTVYDTVYIDVHDTTFIDVPFAVHDTTYITLTDTLTNIIYDTVTNILYDTVTNILYDTVDSYIYDTIYLVDTLWMTLFDTVYHYDTIYIHDTVFVHDEGVGDVETVNVKVYAHSDQIVVEGAEGKKVVLYDVAGRMLAVKQDDFTTLRFDVPSSGTYLLKIGNYPARRVVVIR